MTPLHGLAARNKGMALFPRKIDGKYAMIARQDNENLDPLYSDDLYNWDAGQAILKPQFPWEFVQIGNCGSPIELDEVWPLLTHGVGPVGKYSIGAALLDKRDPTKILARTTRAASPSRVRPNAKAIPQCRLQLWRASATAIRSTPPTPYRIPSPISRRSRFPRCCDRCPESEIARCDPHPARRAPWLAKQATSFRPSMPAGEET